VVTVGATEGARRSRAAGCLKAGLVGCGALVLAPVLLALLGSALAGTDAGERLELGRPPLPRGTLRLLLSEGEFTVVPAEPGSALRVEADYDSARHELVEVREQGSDGSWTYALTLRSTAGLLGWFGGRDEPNRVSVHVPVDLPLDLEADLRRGASTVELGGLDLGRVDLRLRQGAHVVAFSEPTAAPIESIRVNGAMGAVSVSGLGRASPREAEIHHEMGGLDLGLEGEWRTTSLVTASFRYGGCLIRAPANVPLVIEEAHVDAGEAEVPGSGAAAEIEPARPVRLRARGFGGGLSIVR
jgi:hypothetical protein